MKNRTQGHTDPKPAAAIKLGYGSRDLAVDYLEDALGGLADELLVPAHVALRSLLSEICGLSRELDTEPDRMDWRYRCNLESDFSMLKLPALKSAADRAILDVSKYRKWYLLGVALGECSLALKDTGSDQAHVWDKLTAACQNLSEEDRQQVVPCAWWLEQRMSGQELAALLEQVETRYPLPEGNAFNAIRHDPRFCILGFVYEIIAQAEMLGNAAAQRLPKNHARDQWLYGRWTTTNMSHKEIIEELGRHEEWSPIGTPGGIKRAIDKFAERKRLPKPPDRKPGRPPGT